MRQLLSDLPPKAFGLVAASRSWRVIDCMERRWFLLNVIVMGNCRGRSIVFLFSRQCLFSHLVYRPIHENHREVDHENIMIMNLHHDTKSCRTITKVDPPILRPPNALADRLLAVVCPVASNTVQNALIPFHTHIPTNPIMWHRK